MCRRASELDADAEQRSLLADVETEIVGVMIDGEIAISDIGRDRLIEVVAEAAVELPGQIAIGTAADIAIGIGEESRSDGQDRARADERIRPGLA